MSCGFSAAEIVAACLALGLDLDGGVVDAYLRQGVFYAVLDACRIGLCAYDDVYGYGILRGAERPHVQVVHGLDAVDRGDGLSHLPDIYVIGYAVESQAHACAQQP